MKILPLTAIITALATVILAGDEPDTVLKAGAFYEGETLNYVIAPPSGYTMVDREAITDGYSFAFIPDSATYDAADVVIGINIFKIRGLEFTDVLMDDTVSLRQHFGDSIEIWAVPDVRLGSGQEVQTFYINDEDRWLPNVMIAYLDGNTELVIFELVITDHALRPKAEEAFMACLRNSRALPQKTLGDHRDE